MRAQTRMRSLLRFLSSWLPVILWAAMILSAANDRFSDEETGGWLDRIFGATPYVINVAMRKSGHIIAYGVLALLAWRARRSFVAAMLIVVCVAVTDESMQAMTATRAGSAYDVVLDSCAGLLALIAVPGARARLASRRGED